MLVFVALFAECTVLQWLAGALSSDYGGASDESAHFVIARMIRDFLAGGNFADPMGFAQDYYLHYPKVAIGHWPPVFYAALGVWFLIFGSSRIAAMAFIAVVASATGTALYCVGRSLVGRWAGFFAAFLFVTWPLVQRSTGMVMLEHLVTLFSLLAVLRFAKFFSTGSVRDGLLFGVMAVLAILTRGSAWSLGFVPVLVMVLTWRFQLLSRPTLWVSAVPVLVICVPWYLATMGMSRGAFAGAGLDVSFIAQAMPKFAWMIYSSLGVVLIVPIVLGIWDKVIIPLRQGGSHADPVWPALLAMVLATYLIHNLVPASIEFRYMVAVMPPLALFAVAGAEWIVRRASRVARETVLRPVVYGAVAVLFMLDTFQVPMLANGGYSKALAASLPERDGGQQVLLVASWEIGEGSLVAAAAASDDGARRVVLRGSKVLVQENWLGNESRERFQTEEEIVELLERIPVDVVILDETVPNHRKRKYHSLLERTMLGNPDKWSKIGVFPVFRFGEEYPRALHVFAARSRPRDEPRRRTDYPFIRKLTERQ